MIYLRKSNFMKLLIFENFTDFKLALEKELPTGNWYQVTQQMINDFAMKATSTLKQLFEI